MIRFFFFLSRIECDKSSERTLEGKGVEQVSRWLNRGAPAAAFLKDGSDQNRLAATERPQSLSGKRCCNCWRVNDAFVSTDAAV